MSIDPEALLALDFAPRTARVAARDAALYALGTGAGLDPSDPAQTAWLVGTAPPVIPTFATVLGYESFWAGDPRTGIDARQAIHLCQHVEIHRPLPLEATVRRETRITGVRDRGAGLGALVAVEEDLRLADSGAHLARLSAIVLCRAEGGCGDAGHVPGRGACCPGRAPDRMIAVPTAPQQALIYQLSGDRNPLHLEPTVARAAGFDRPILQGLSTFGAACRVLVDALADGRPERLAGLSARFAAPVVPGDSLELDLWRLASGRVSFRLRFAGGGQAALDEGLCVLA